MGGSSKSQVTGYRYFANFLLFIGNPIDDLIGINFDKRGWIVGDRVNEGDKGELIAIKAQNIYGENEGGVFGVINLHTGTNTQLPDVKYSQYMRSIGLKASAYPYQSYLSFSGSGKANTGNGWIDGVFGVLAGYMNNAFYLGNSGYMKEMLLWPKRIHVRNDGRGQWYDEKAQIFGGNIDLYAQSLSSVKLIAEYKGVFVSSNPIDLTEIKYIDMNNDSAFKSETVIAYGNKAYIDSHVSTRVSIETSGTAQCEITLKYRANREHITVDLPLKSKLISKTTSGNSVTEVYSAVISTDLPIHVKVSDLGPVGEYAYIEVTSIEIKGFYPKTTFDDINPIHKIREILTDDTAMNKPESDVNDVNFMKAADRVRGEGLGISWSITEKSCLEAIEELCGHIEAGVRVNRQTGLYEMVLFRDDWFEENEIHTLAVNKIKSMSLEVANADEAINQLNVSYYNRDAIKDSSFSIAENASIRNLSGRVNAEDADFPYFMNQRNAAVVAQWKLKQMSSPVWKGSFTTAEYNARKWNRYDLLKLAWPRKWQGTITVRIMKINLGTGADVSIDFVEVVHYSSNLSSDIVIDEPIDTAPKPPQPALFKAFELSYLEAVQLNGQKAVDEALAYNSDAGYAAVIAKRPQNNSLSALMYTSVGDDDYERVGVITYSETAELDHDISQTNTTFIVKNASSISVVGVGTQITINNEIMVYQSYDEETSVLTVKRGALDTIPQNHSAGSVLYFSDDFITVDSTEYVASEVVNVKALTTTPSGILNLEDAEAQQVEMQARAIRPYPPANVKINGEYWPEEIETDLVLTWVDRNRLQQTGGKPLSYFDAGVSIEPSVTYSIKIIERGVNNIILATHELNDSTLNSYTLLASSMQPTTISIQVAITSVRDGYESYQSFKHTVNRASFFSEPYNIEFTVSDL